MKSGLTTMSFRAANQPALGKTRRAHPDDAASVVNLITEAMVKTFNCESAANIRHLIENSVLAVSQMDVKGTLVAFAAVKDYPHQHAVHPLAWEDFLWTRYKTVELNGRNTLFLHLLCWQPNYGREVVDHMLRNIFMVDPHVHHVAFIKQAPDFPLLIPGQSTSEASFRKVAPHERLANVSRLPSLCIADRDRVCPRLKIRRAVEEDNDEIVTMMDAQSTRLRALYGEFYVSELIARHPESDRVLLVCEHRELAVGVICLNTQINYEALEENFELSPFAGLRKMNKKPTFQKTFTISSDTNLFNNKENLPASSHAMFTNQDLKHDRKVSLGGETVGTEQTSSQTYSQAESQRTHIFMLESEQDIDFDFINIDPSLLTVPWYPQDIISQVAPSYADLIDFKHGESNMSSYQKHKKKIDGVARLVPKFQPVRYSGAPNAFILELFAMNPDYDERHGFDMLEASFELFPDRDYCIVSLPTDHTAFPLLEHFTFVTPYASKKRFINETLYVAHVNSVRGVVSVRPGEACDLASVGDILEHVPGRTTLTELFRSTLSSHTFHSFLFLSENQPVGLAVLGPLQDRTTVRSQYALDRVETCPGSDGAVLVGVLSPALEPHARWYARELLRHTEYSTLFWICPWLAKDTKTVGNLMSLTAKMEPVRPRRCVPNFLEPQVSSLEITASFALWYLERPLTTLPKIDVNQSIVVVGASCTGLAFLETLLLGPSSKYLSFTNITLISKHGIPVVADCIAAAESCVPRDDSRFTDHYIKSLPFYFYLDVITEVMVKIDRKKKFIQLKNGDLKFYDELVLTCGEQFQHPEYLNESFEREKELQKGKPCERTLMDNPRYTPDRVPNLSHLPDNVMLINSVFEANKSLHHLQDLIDKDVIEQRLNPENRIMVYGDCIEAYSCLAALLELGIASDLIGFIEPFPSDEPTAMRVNCFNNEMVDERVQMSVENLGISVYRGCSLEGWATNYGDEVFTLKLLSPACEIFLPCFALFYYDMKAIDINAFKAINESGLVYDGGVTVGVDFMTNDPHVSAAGPGTRPIRRLRVGNAGTHRNYRSEDVGERLGRQFLQKFDPFLASNTSEQDSDGESTHTRSGTCSRPSYQSSMDMAEDTKWRPALSFDSPIMSSATLPGPLYYMKVRAPGLEIPMEIQLSLPKQGHTLITDKNRNYFRLQVDALHRVSAITCLSHERFPVDILSQLYGKHERLFNQLLQRFQFNMIDDLYTYFTQPWMSALYHEAFSDTFQNLTDHQMDMKGVSEPLHDLVENFIATAANDERLDCTECDWQRIRKEATDLWKTVQGDNITASYLRQYLHTFNIEHPHYAIPK